MTQILPIAATYYNVKQYGAKGDGSTDDTIAIQAAINAAAGGVTNGTNTVGGVVVFPPGAYIHTGLVIYSFIHLWGSGIGATILQLKNGANADSVQGYNAASLIGGSSTGGVANWSIKDLTIDGNKSNQTGVSFGIRQYGYGFILQNVRVRNTYSDALRSDWNGGASSPGNDSMEAQVNNCKFHDTGTSSMGVNWTGPHDSQFANCISYKTGSHAFYVGPNAGGMQFTNCHGWGMSTGVSALSFFFEGISVCVNCAAEGSDTMQVVMLANGCVWSGGRIFSGGIASNNTNGLQIGQAAGNMPYNGSANQSAGLTTAVSVSMYFVDSKFSNCEGTNGSIWFANDGGLGFIRGPVVLNSGDGNTNSVATGSVSATTQLWLTPSGTVPTPDGTLAKGGRAKIPVNGNNAFTVSDTSQDIFNVNTHNTRVELVNGTVIRGYSDNYSTTAYQLDSTISLTGSSSAAAIASSGTAATSGVGICRLSPTAAVTGCILQSGTRAWQEVWVVNEATAANSVSWATQATSHIAGESGGTFVLAGEKAQKFVWDAAVSLWFKAS